MQTAIRWFHGLKWLAVQHWTLPCYPSGWGAAAIVFYRCYGMLNALMSVRTIAKATKLRAKAAAAFAKESSDMKTNVNALI